MAAPSQGRVLVVDDDDGVRTSVGLMLRNRGYMVDLAANAAEALALLGQFDIDIMLLDLYLPDQNGLQVMQQAVELRPHLAIIILTGHATLDSAIGSVKSGRVVDYLRKPAGWREIVRAVSHALARKSDWRRHEHEAALYDQVAGAPDSRPERQAGSDQLFWPPLTLDLRQNMLQIAASDARIIRLTRGEAAVLAVMMANPDKTHTCARLARQALGYDLSEAEARPVIRPYIFRLRQKIEADSARPQIIRNVRGQGYALGPPPDRPAKNRRSRG